MDRLKEVCEREGIRVVICPELGDEIILDSDNSKLFIGSAAKEAYIMEMLAYIKNNR